VVRNVIALVACIAVAVMALGGHEPAPPGTPPGPVELAVAEERLSVVDGSTRERGSEPRRAAVRRYEPAQRDRKRRNRVRRRPQTSLAAAHSVRAVADVADPAPVVPRTGAGRPGAGGDERAGPRRAPSGGGQQRPSGAAPRAPRHDASGDRGAPAPAPPPPAPPPPPPPPPAAVPAVPSVSAGADESDDDAAGGAEEPGDDADELSSDD
jgi:hypothetical protein